MQCCSPRTSLLIRVSLPPSSSSVPEEVADASSSSEEEEEEEEEEEAVLIRGVNTNEDSPNAQHAPPPPVQDTGAMSVWSRYMPDLQLCCSV